MQQQDAHAVPGEPKHELVKASSSASPNLTSGETTAVPLADSQAVASTSAQAPAAAAASAPSQAPAAADADGHNHINEDAAAGAAVRAEARFAAATAAAAAKRAAAAAAAAAAGPGDGTTGGTAASEPPKIRVIIRKRPINDKETERGEVDEVVADGAACSLTVNETKYNVRGTPYFEKHLFGFDVVLDENAHNEHIYRLTAEPLVPILLTGGNATCFAYGQTGSGKTYTMSSLPMRAATDILAALAAGAPEFAEVSLRASCFELYGKLCFDLLNERSKLRILEDSEKVVVKGLKEVVIADVDAVLRLMIEANQCRSVGSTSANADSSRSHSILQFSLKKDVPASEEAAAGLGGNRPLGKLSFVDLAGGERGIDTAGESRKTRLEGAEINLSLLALKECIRALDGDARHIPFRGSKLTAVLRDSFVGSQATTVMIANISPNTNSVEHTLNTLRYADRVRELRKDKADRTVGGVTPGEASGYNASVVGGGARPSDMEHGDSFHTTPGSALSPGGSGRSPPTGCVIA